MEWLLVTRSHCLTSRTPEDVFHKLFTRAEENHMDLTALLIIILIIVLIGGGGYYGRGRWY
jgi:hypothetical protein